MSPTYTLYHGTFIQLPRHIATETKPSLEINTGVLWVSNCDGRIQGFDWSVTLDSADEGEKGLNAFVQTKGWTVWRDGVDPTEGRETVSIIQGGRKGRNGFFFPGFIGIFLCVKCEEK
jgi:guanine deaminase